MPLEYVFIFVLFVILISIQYTLNKMLLHLKEVEKLLHLILNKTQ